MSRIKTFTDVGMPFHGRAEDGTLTTPAGAKSVCNESFQYSRQCLVVRHPAAPGASRSTEQQTHDTAQGHEWRDYALLCGPNRCINGHDPGLGAAHWLYCDAGGATWDVYIEQIDNTTDITFKLWLGQLFGRIGRQRPFTAQTLDTYLFSIPIPSWYAGSLTAADVVGNVGFNVYANDDGSAAIINLVCLDPPAEELYFETCLYDYENGFLEGPALIGTLAVALSGNGDIDNNGNGITGTITTDLEFETGLVTTRTYSGTGLNVPFAPNDQFIVTGQFACPTTTPQTTTETLTYTPDSSGVSGPLADTSDGEGWTIDAILRKTPDGTVSRAWRNRVEAGDYTIAYSGSVALELNLTTTAGPSCQVDCENYQGIDWFITSCNWSGSANLTRTVNKYDYRDITITAFGEVFSHTYERFEYFQEVYKMFPTEYNICGCTNQDTPGVTSTTNTEQWELDGVTLSGPGEIYHDFRPFAQNAMYIAFDFDNGNAAPNGMTFDENYVLVNDAGIASTQNTQLITHDKIVFGLPQMPNQRHWVWSYQPVTGEFISNLKAADSIGYSGTVWQYC